MSELDVNSTTSSCSGVSLTVTLHDGGQFGLLVLLDVHEVIGRIDDFLLHLVDIATSALDHKDWLLTGHGGVNRGVVPSDEVSNLDALLAHNLSHNRRVLNRHSVAEELSRVNSLIELHGVPRDHERVRRPRHGRWILTVSRCILRVDRAHRG